MLITAIVVDQSVREPAVIGIRIEAENTARRLSSFMPEELAVP